MVEQKTKPSPVFPAPEWTGVSADIAASLAHEIRNPLLAIKGAAQLLEQVVGGEDKPLAELIVAEAKRIEQLVATMDPLTPNPATNPEPVNIHEVTEYVRLAAHSLAPAVQFVTDYDPSLPPVMAVRDALVQAVMNLVKNACEACCHPGLATGDPGIAQAKRDDGLTPTVTLTTRYLLGERMQRVGGRKLPIQLRISDNGAGVPPELVARLFTPFTSTKPDGRGLGLAIVAKIIEEHEGLIAYEGQPGHGAVFSLYLPSA